MASIKAPFNFVPLNKVVFYPDWADSISHDVPFEDGMSGTIKFRIVAQTPIFVRNGHTKNDADSKNENYKSFSKTPDNQFFIPATSIKGELRNIIEVLSFGKIILDNKRYAIRDLQLRNYRDRFVYENIHCGWMTLKNDEISISDRGIPFRISHEEIDLRLNLHKNFCKLFGPDSKIKDENKSATYKYGLIDSTKILKTYKFTTFRISESTVDKRMGSKFDNNGDVAGRIVFTGQPGPRKPGYKFFNHKAGKEVIRNSTGKFWEFVFPEEEIYSYTLNWNDEMMEDFKFIYKDSTDWSYWKNKLEKGEQIPVFLCVENDVVKSIGLSYLYKLPFDKRMNEMLPKDHQMNKLDLAACIFGDINGNMALRGRVQVSNAFCIDAKRTGSIDPYMASPKPTYYPIYLQQKGKNGFIENSYTTMLDKNAQIKGRKMYPIRRTQSEFYVPEGQDNNTCPAQPLDKGSVFVCSIRYNNLKRVELGALISAIELRTSCYHSLGAFKPYGYGACDYCITSEIEEKEMLKQEFKRLMETSIENYSKSAQIKEFWSMLNVNTSNQLKSPLEYMELDDFVDCKRNNPSKDIYGQYLPLYSELTISQKPVSATPVMGKAQAKVTVFSGKFRQAALLEGKAANQSKPLEDCSSKLKIGDIIEVMVVYSKNGNVERLKFCEKL